MAKHGDGGGDNVIRQQPALENVNLNVEGNARATGDRALTPAAMISSLAEVDHFNKTFDPSKYSVEDLTAMLSKNQAGIEGTKQYLSERSRDLVKVTNIADAERSGYINPLTIHHDV